MISMSDFVSLRLFNSFKYATKYATYRYVRSGPRMAHRDANS